MYKYLFLLGCIIVLCSCEQKTKNETQVSGEFTHRLTMCKERLTGSKFQPEFTSEFILADVNIDPGNPRRFYNYSGDLSGRYIEALSNGCHKNCSHLDELVKQVLKFQQPDGRFGDKELVFKEAYIGADHMPLLWGNGRLLVGLLEYYTQTKEETVLSAAVRLGDFFLNTYQEVTPAVAKKLDGRGADGIICFTQYVEALVLLSNVTNDPKYAAVAARIYPTLPARGTLHTHGYLTTLRGVLALYEYDRNQQHLDYVVNAYTDLVNSDDYTIYGSVKEYFGKNGKRDEGCSTADFIQLSLHLYRITKDVSFLERAEFAIHNALYFNQFFTGDFGHHTANHISSQSEIMQAAWWCCTMAGLKVMQTIQDEYFVEHYNGNLKINLFIDAEYHTDDASLSLKKAKMNGDFHVCEIYLHEMNSQKDVMIRKPSWVDEVNISVNGKASACQLNNGYLTINQKIKSGDVIQIHWKYQCRIITPAKENIKLTDIKQPVFGALCYGPHLMAVDNALDYCFLAEPNHNIIYSNTIQNGIASDALSPVLAGSFLGDSYLTAFYKHGGFPSYFQTVFRPVSEMTYQRHPYMMVSMTFTGDDNDNPAADQSMTRPWMINNYENI